MRVTDHMNDLLGCDCAIIKATRQDERDRISKEVEALPYNLTTWSKEIGGIVSFTRANAYTRVLHIVNGDDY